MTQIDIYVFLLCLIVFSVLTLLSVVCVLCILKLKLKIINSGIEDEQIKTEYEKNKNKKRGVIDIITTSVLCVIVFVLMAFTVFSNVSNKISSNTVPSLFVVKSSSMEKKNPKNTYLTENNLNNQFAIHDLILTYKMPDQFDLKLYDIVVYEVDGILLIHRIVAIEEPNANHPNERYFLCQGDALESPDRFPVKYEQMRAIYKNQRLPFVGSIVSFLQSPAGWLCLLLLASSIIFTPVLEKKLQKAKLIRLRISLGNDLEQETKQTSTELEPNFIGFIENKNLTLQERIKLLSDKQKQNLELICNKLSTQSNLRKF